MSEVWMKWTFLEACMKTISKIFQKVIGAVGASFNNVVFATVVVGLVQVSGGFIMARAKGKEIFTDSGSILGSCWFGFNACVCTILPFYIFVLPGADIGVNTFIITLSIIPGALIDRFWFSYRLNNRKWIGVVIAIFAGYSILGWPSLSEFMKLPLWIWLSFLVMMLNAINQGITQKIKKIDPFVKNFWVGLVTLFLALLVLSFRGSLNLLTDFSPDMLKLWGASAVVGLVVIGMLSFNLLSYKEGAHIALKKLVMFGSFLSMSMFAGIMFFNEPVTLAKIVGVGVYFIAFIVMDDNTWNYVLSKFKFQNRKEVSCLKM